jgi:hypothetical protein
MARLAHLCRPQVLVALRRPPDQRFGCSLEPMAVDEFGESGGCGGTSFPAQRS